MIPPKGFDDEPYTLKLNLPPSIEADALAGYVGQMCTVEFAGVVVSGYIVQMVDIAADGSAAATLVQSGAPKPMKRNAGAEE